MFNNLQISPLKSSQIKIKGISDLSIWQSSETGFGVWTLAVVCLECMLPAHHVKIPKQLIAFKLCWEAVRVLEVYKLQRNTAWNECVFSIASSFVSCLCKLSLKTYPSAHCSIDFCLFIRNCLYLVKLRMRRNWKCCDGSFLLQVWLFTQEASFSTLIASHVELMFIITSWINKVKLSK